MIKVKVRSSQNRIATATANEITKATEEGMSRQRTANCGPIKQRDAAGNAEEAPGLLWQAASFEWFHVRKT